MDEWKRLGVDDLDLFCEEFKHGYDAPDPIIREQNRLIMKRKLLDLIVGARLPQGGKTPGGRG